MTEDICRRIQALIERYLQETLPQPVERCKHTTEEIRAALGPLFERLLIGAITDTCQFKENPGPINQVPVRKLFAPACVLVCSFPGCTEPRIHMSKYCKACTEVLMPRMENGHERT